MKTRGLLTRTIPLIVGVLAVLGHVNLVAAFMECPAIDDPQKPVFYSGPSCFIYYRCHNGYAIPQNCPSDLHWNSKENICDYPWEAGCAEDITANTTTSLCPPGTPPLCHTTSTSAIEYHPHPNDCHWYYFCTSGVAHCTTCVEGLFYNPATETCDDIERAECKKETTEAPNSTPSHPKPGHCPGTFDPTKPDCPLCICDGTTYKHPYECEWYYKCEDHLPVLHHCPGGFHWNEEYKICDYPCLAGCDPNNDSSEPPTEPTTSPTTESTTSTEPPTTTELPTEPPVTEPSTTEPPPTEPSTTEPPPTEPPATEPSEESTTESSSGGCPAATLPSCPNPDPPMAVFFPHPTTCHWYFECSNGTPYCMPCPSNLHWNTELNVCDYPNEANCSVSKTWKPQL